MSKPRILHHIVTADETGMTVKHLLKITWQISSTLINSIKWRTNGITLNGSPVTVAVHVKCGDDLAINIADDATRSPHILPVDYPLDILYEDEDLLILNKPAGITVHCAALTEETVTIAGAVAHYLGDNSVFHPVNRLDRGVTGIMVVAKNGYMHARCMDILHTDAFRREYRGICRGIPAPDHSIIDLPITRDPQSVLRRMVMPNGLPAQTEYTVLQSGDNRALLRLRPLTGRTHQLRLHCASIGHPLLGDWLYGIEDHSIISRPALHSYELWLQHPLSGKILHIVAPLPDDMAKLLP